MRIRGRTSGSLCATVIPAIIVRTSIFIGPNLVTRIGNCPIVLIIRTIMARVKDIGIWRYPRNCFVGYVPS